MNAAQPRLCARVERAPTAHHRPAITATILVAEVIGGILTGSLALFASWLAGRVATLEPTPGACSLDTPEGRDACLAQPTVPAHHHPH